MMDTLYGARLMRSTGQIISNVTDHMLWKPLCFKLEGSVF